MYKNEHIEKCMQENRGSKYLIRGYIHTQDKQYNELAINDLGFICNKQDELEEFKSELIKANINEFILTESSSGLMSNLHALNAIGIKIKEVKSVMYIDKWNNKECFVEGLKMVVEA